MSSHQDMPIYAAWTPWQESFLQNFDRLHAKGARHERYYSNEIDKVPELTSAIGIHGQTLLLRSNLALPQSKRRPDFVLRTYGTPMVDIIECKGPLQPFLTPRTEVPSSYFKKALRQIYSYNDIFEKVEREFDINFNNPRLFLIGYAPKYSHKHGTSSQEMLKQWIFQNGDKRYQLDYLSGKLNIATWQDMRDRIAQSPTLASDRVEKFFLDCISRSAARSRVIDELIGSGDTLISELVEIEAKKRMIAMSKTQRNYVISRSSKIYDLAIALSIPDSAHRNAAFFDDIVLIAEFLFYDGSMDFAVGEWIQGATVNLQAIINANPLIHDIIAQKILIALEHGDSEDLICRLSMILRNSLSDGLVKEIALSRIFRQKWEIERPEDTIDDSATRLTLVASIQLDIALASRGLPEAIDRINEIALQGKCVSDIAKWHIRHGRSHPSKFVRDLKLRVDDPHPRNLPFMAWHKSIFHHTDRIFEEIALYK